LLSIKRQFAYNTIDDLNRGKRGGGVPKGHELSIGGDIDKEVIDIFKEGRVKNLYETSERRPTFKI